MEQRLDENPIKRQRGRPRLIRASSTNVEGPRPSQASSLTVEKAMKPISSNPPKQTESKAKQTKTAEKRQYKAELQKYIKERIKQGKAEIKLDATIKQLEAKIKAMQS